MNGLAGGWRLSHLATFVLTCQRGFGATASRQTFLQRKRTLLLLIFFSRSSNDPVEIHTRTVMRLGMHWCCQVARAPGVGPGKPRVQGEALVAVGCAKPP